MRKYVVKSSKELTQGQKSKLEKELSNLAGEQGQFEYSVEDIIGGLVITDGDKIIDMSFSSRLKDLRVEMQSLAEHLKAQGKPFVLSDATKKLGKLITERQEQKAKQGLVSSKGQVVSSADGVVKIKGLSSCRYGELLQVGQNHALAMNLAKDGVGAILLSDPDQVQYGDTAFSTGNIMEVPVGEALFGRVVNSLGQPIDGLPLRTAEKRRVENVAPGVFQRDKVSQPLSTGILAIDAMIPIGKGQRELIIGDRQTGKTTIALDTILNQKGKDVYCVYVAIGQRAGTITKIIDKLKGQGAMEYTAIVAATADQSAPLQYLAPYTGCAIAEHMMYQGKDVLVVYDDLSKHAAAYRAISLLLKRPAGREAYPGDIFYIHSRLLERAAKLNKEMGGGSLTALPIVETLAGDISAYIPTNIISITDGQIYLETELFNANVRPAINVGLSVSRVGGSAQPYAIRQLASKLRLELAQFRELRLFSQFGSDIDRATQLVLSRGERVLQALIQPEGSPMDTLQEIAYLFAINTGALEGVPLIMINRFLQGFYNYYKSAFFKDARELALKGELTPTLQENMAKAIQLYSTYFEIEVH